MAPPISSLLTGAADARWQKARLARFERLPPPNYPAQTVHDAE
jgi:hypothetical protein